MSIAGVLTRFTLAYVGLLIASAMLFRSLGTSSRSGVDVAILIASVLWPCMAFSARNGRYFTPSEKRKVVWGMIGINLALQVLFGGAMLAAQGRLSPAFLLSALAIVGVLYSIGIYVFVGIAGKRFEKQQAKKLGS